MTQQKIVRTYPTGFINPTKALTEALRDGWRVIMSNTFDCGNGKTGTEYVLEK